MAALRRSRLLLPAAGATVLAGVLLGCQAAGNSGAEVVSDSSAKTGWVTIEYQGIRVDLPSGLDRIDGCDVPWEHWGPPGRSACASDGGVYLSGSATFDPAHGPAVRRTELDGAGDGWAGYVLVGELAVYAADRDRDVVEKLLASARVTAN